MNILKPPFKSVWQQWDIFQVFVVAVPKPHPTMQSVDEK